MISQTKKTYLFILLTGLARGMIEVFIPIYLYKAGFSLNGVFEYFFYMLLISLIISYPLTKLGGKIKNKYLIISSTFFLAIMYHMLLSVTISKFYTITLAFMYATYRRTYWIGRRYYALRSIPTENMGKNVSLITIVTQIGSMSAAYLGALFLNHTSNYVLFIVSIITYFIGTLLIIKVQEPEKRELKDIRYVFKHTPPLNFLYMFLNEILYINSFIFPLYLYLYIKSDFEYIGLFNIFTGISSIIFIYLFSKKMDRDRKDYKFISYTGLGLIFLLKTRVSISFIILLIGLLEGIFSNMQEVAFNRNMYYWGNHFDKLTYNSAYELLQNGARLFLFMILTFITDDLKLLIIISAILIIINGLIPFDDGEGGYI